MKELFKTIKDYPKYKISNLGNVMGTRGTILKGSRVGTRGYLAVNLYKGNTIESRKLFQIHKLMAMVFLSHTKESGLVVDHIDNDPMNNNLNNLQLITHRENCSKEKEDVGVHFCNTQKRWIARIQINGKNKYLGCSKDKEDALLLYNNKLKNI